MGARDFGMDLWRMKIEDHRCCLEEYDAYMDKSRLRGRIKRWAFSLIIISDSSIHVRRILRSSAARFAEKERQLKSKFWYIIHPFSSFRLFWMILMTLVWWTALLVIPFAHSFTFVGVGELSHGQGRRDIYLIMMVLNGICWVDIVVNFFTGYYERHTKDMVIDQRRIFRKYFSGFFFFDLASSNPYFNYLQHTSEVSLLNGSLGNIGFVLLDSLKLVRIYSILDNVSFVLKLTALPTTWHRAIKLFLLFLQLLHWSACVAYVLPFAVHGQQLTDKYHENYYTEYKYCWVNMFGLPGQTYLMKYRFSALRALAHLSTIGVCVTASQFLQVDLIIRGITVMTGYFFNAYLFACVMRFSMINSHAYTRYYEILNQVEQFMYHKLFPPSLQQKMRSYYEYRYQHRFYQEHNILQALSEPIRREVALECCKRMVENVSIFKDLPRATVASIVTVLHSEIFLEDDVIVAAGSVGHCMYFLASGSVAVLLSTGKEICHLYDGAHFGEVSLLFESEKRIATVMALETCECYRLDRQDFRRILADHRGLEHTISALALKRQKDAVFIDEMCKREEAKINIGKKLR